MKNSLRRLLIKLLWSGVRRKVAFERPTIIAVAGSIGKTSTKEALALLLAAGKRPVVKTEGNLGTDTGVPLSLFGFLEPPTNALGWVSVFWRALFPPRQQYAKRPYYVLEYSSDKPGDIDFLTRQLPIAIGVLTTVAPVHLQAFANLEALVTEELALARGLAPEGLLVANADDPYHQRLIGNPLWYGLSEVEVSMQQLGLEVSVAGELFQTQLVGRHHLYPLLAALTVARHEEIALGALKKAVASYQVPPGRGRLLTGKDDITIIDDTYNSSPEAVKASLVMLREFGGSRRKVAVLGRMNELGERSQMLHEEVAKAAAKVVDLLVLVGEYGEVMRAAAIAALLPAAQIIIFSTPEACLTGIEALLHPADVLLVKASQNGMQLERVVKLLLADPADSFQLVRQAGHWQHL